MKKYKDFYEEEKHEKAPQKYPENHTNEMEIINLYKRGNKAKAVTKTAPKAPKSGYHLFFEGAA